MTKISPSLLSCDFAYLMEGIDTMTRAGADYLHYDVMDGHFVPNISFGYSILKNIRDITDLYLDVHLMISDPQKYAQNFIDSGASLITFHYEAMNEEDIDTFIDFLHSKHVDAGISIKPDTPVDVLKPYLDKLDLVLVMSVEPGFGGQSFKESSLDKIEALSKLRGNRKYLIEVDGGINAETGPMCIKKGADVLVAGSYLFNAQDKKKAMDAIR